jgi:single-strand DNA-binding protein
MYHTIILIGNLGKEPELRYTSNGKSVTTLNVASNRNYKGADGETVKETIWFRVSVWDKQAETVNQYLHKGSKVLIEGRLQPDDNGNPRVWQDKEGKAQASFGVSASTVRFLDSKGEAQEEVPF